MMGKRANHIIIAVRGNMSYKENIVVEIFSFDLLKHSEGKKKRFYVNVQTCIDESYMIMDYVH